MRRRARAQREFLRRIDPDRRDALRQSLEAGGFEPPTLTSFTMTGASSLYGESDTHYEQQRLEAVPGGTPAAPAIRAESFERLTRAMANTSSRRQALKVLGAAAAAAVGAAVLKPLGVATAVTCPDGRQACGNACCPKKYTCSSSSPADAVAATACCCPPGTAPCGRHCCDKGVACLDASRDVCGCPAGTTPCGTTTNPTCCPAGTACPGTNSTSCPAPNTAAFCTAVNSTVIT